MYRLTEEGMEFRRRLQLRGIEDRSPMEGRIFSVLSAVSKGRLLARAAGSMRIQDSLDRMGINYLPFEELLERLVQGGYVENV